MHWGQGVQQWQGMISDNPSSEMKRSHLAIARSDLLYMPPFAPHLVLTINGCFAVGVHFYDYDCIESTMKAIVVEHYFGLNYVKN